MDESPQPKYFTKEPWWLILIGGAVAALLPLFKYGGLQRAIPGVGLAEAMATAGLLGAAASAPLVARSHIRSVGWSNLVLCLDMLVIAIGVCFVVIAMSA